MIDKVIKQWCIRGFGEDLQYFRGKNTAIAIATSSPCEICFQYNAAGINSQARLFNEA